jgi:hypothetical protein
MADDAKQDEATGSKKPRRSMSTSEVRTRVAQLVWAVCVVFALFLAVGALLIALGGSVRESNALVSFILDGAHALDLGVFSLEDGIFERRGKNSEIINALLNWGTGAIFWLILGRVLDRVIRP